MDFTDPTTLRSTGTVFLFLAFVGLCVWVFSARQRRRFEEASRLPLDDEETPEPPRPQGGDR